VSDSDVEILIGLLAAIALLAQLAEWLRIPYPVLLVLGGLGLGFVPGLPAPRVDPDVFLLLFLPPLLYSEAYLYSTEELKAVATEVFLLAVGLVAATTVGVAVVAHAVAGLPWVAAFVLGAVVGSTDPVAATAVIRRLGVSERIVTILEGESLVNDATALVAYKLAVGAAVAGTISLAHASVEFVWASAGGIATGAIVAWLAPRVVRWITVPEVEIALSLLMPFAAYFPAERLGASGVLAAVTAGLLLGRRAHESPAGTRLRRHAFWEVLVFLLNSALFLLVGLGFPDILDALDVRPLDLLWQAIALTTAVATLRFAWMFLVPRAVAAFGPLRTQPPERAELLVLGWSGMRGGVSVAAALSVPVLADGRPFPARPEIVFFSYVIVLATLVVPGLTLGPLIRRLEVGSREQARTEARARAHLLHAALEHIEELVDKDELPGEIAERLRRLYESRLAGLESLVEAAWPHGDEAAAARRGAIAAERAALADLEARHEVGSRFARDVERELAAEERDISRSG
jgi:CPA1 family monovalent cation:H+ antiporter